MIEKMKNIALIVLFLIVIAGAYFYFSAWQDAKEKIDKAENDQAALIADRVQLTQQIAELTAQQHTLVKQIETHQQSINTYQNEIDNIEKELQLANKKTVAEYDDQTIAQQFKDTYQLTDKNIQIMQVPLEGSPWKERVLTLPIDYVKLTVTAHDSKVACQQQSALKTQIIDLNQAIYDLQQLNIKLEQDKSMAYSQGYEKAFTMYLEVNKLYIDLLKNPPKVELAPSWWQLTLGALGGALICTL
jgi:cbb3-type cytochrome oxidase subunit 3